MLINFDIRNVEVTVENNATVVNGAGNNAVKKSNTAACSINVNDDSGELNTQNIRDRSNEHLIDNTVTYGELRHMLLINPAIAAESALIAKARDAAKTEAARKAQLRQKFGSDYDVLFEKGPEKRPEKRPEKGSEGKSGEIEETEAVKAIKQRRPGAVQLRMKVPRIARIKLGDSSICEVYSNGYAIYDNGDRKTVLWAAGCGAVSYFFNVTDKEKQYLPHISEVGSDILDGQPWYKPIAIAGENYITFNIFNHPKNKSVASDINTNGVNDGEEVNSRSAAWACGSHYDNPEEALLKKEAAEMVRLKVNGLTNKQSTAIKLHYFDGYTQKEAAAKLNITQSSFCEREKNAKNTLLENLQAN